MKNKIIIVGDSFTYGIGCDDRLSKFDDYRQIWYCPVAPPGQASIHCWASLAANEFINYQFVNVAIPGNSHDNMFKQLASEINDDTKLVMFCGTFIHRMLLNATHNMSLPMILSFGPNVLWSAADYTKAFDQFIKHLYHESMGINYAIMSVLSAKAISESYKAKFVCSLTLRGEAGFMDDHTQFDYPSQTNQLLTIVNDNIFQSIVDYPFMTKCNAKKDSWLFPDRHTNNYGHALYYEHEIKPLLTKLLT